MEFYQIIIIVIVLIIILYNITYGFSLFNKKRTIIIYDVEVEELQKLRFQSVINKFVLTSVNILYDKDKRTATIQEAFDTLLISGIQGISRVQIESTIFPNIRDSVMFTVFKTIDLRLEGEFKKHDIEGIWQNTILTFPETQKLFRLKESSSDDFNYIFKSGDVKELSLIILNPIVVTSP